MSVDCGLPAGWWDVLWWVVLVVPCALSLLSIRSANRARRGYEAARSAAWDTQRELLGLRLDQKLEGPPPFARGWRPPGQEVN